MPQLAPELVVALVAASSGSMIASSVIQSNGMRDASKAQLDAATENRNQALPYADMSIAAAAPTSSEISQLQTMVTNQQQQITLNNAAYQRDASILDSLNPAIMASVKNAQAIMQGGEAPALAPIRQQREIQRNQLMTQLNQSMGPGAENSSAGIEALSQFDMQTAGLMAQANQSYLGSMGQYTGMGIGANNSINASDQQGGMNIAQMGSNILGGYDNLQKRQMFGYNSKISALEGTALAPYSGGDGLANAQLGRNLGNMASNFTGAATMGAAYKAWAPGSAGTVAQSTPIEGSSAGYNLGLDYSMNPISGGGGMGAYAPTMGANPFPMGSFSPVPLEAGA